jgi:hypothetical protein
MLVRGVGVDAARRFAAVITGRSQSSSTRSTGWRAR